MSKNRSGKSLSVVSAKAPAELALPVITQSQAIQIQVRRAKEKYDDAVRQQTRNVQEFEASFGPCDAIDADLVAEVQRLQLRFAAIHARQQRAPFGEPKVSKFVAQLGDMVGAMSTHLMTNRAIGLFAKIEEHKYFGYGGNVGELGRDDSVLEGYTIVDDLVEKRASSADGDVCGHANVEPYEDGDGAGLGVCTDCGSEVVLEATAVPDAAEAAA